MTNGITMEDIWKAIEIYSQTSLGTIKDLQIAALDSRQRIKELEEEIKKLKATMLCPKPESPEAEEAREL